MADSIYEQALETAATQLKTIIDSVDTSLTPESTVPIRALDSADIAHLQVVLCWSEDVVESDDLTETHVRDKRGYPLHFYMILPARPHPDTRWTNVLKVKQKVRQHFNWSRRMSAVVESNVNNFPCLVLDRAPKLNPKILGDRTAHGLTIMAWFLEPRVEIT